ncbi:MAG: lysophospholipid acyltransferase family protein, partial [bacterium]
SDLRAGRIVAIFPDGPTGPRHQLKEGVIQLAKRSGAPILPISYSARPAKIFNSWDQFMVMLPFSRGVLIIGEPITIPHKVRTAPSGAKETDDFKDEDFWKNFVCNALNEVECQADRLVMDLERFAVNEAEKKISDKGFPEEIF